MARTAALILVWRGCRAAMWAVFGLAVLLTGVGCVTPGGANSSVSAWVVGGARELNADTPPLLENEVYSASRGVVEMAAAINETVSFQLALRTDVPPAGPFDVRLTDLRGPGGSLAAGAVARIYRAHYVRVSDFDSWYPARTGRSATARAFPDILVPWDAPRGGGPLRLDQTRNEIVWVDVFVPPTTEPGTYTGRLEVSATGARRQAFACDVRLEVVPVAIPSARSLPVICRVDPRDLLADNLNWPRLTAEETRILPDAPSHQAARRLVDATMRVLHEHHATPVLWAGFPKYRLTGERTVAIDWEAYDGLAEGWLDGDAFSDRLGLARWPIPVSDRYPDADRNGGFGSARYARLLAAYLAECNRHFEERGWSDRAFVRLLPPSEPTPDAIERVRRVASIVRQSETRLPLVAHLPVRSLRALGWHNAPNSDSPDVDIWAPPARWFEPEALERQRGLGRQAWFMPDTPPQSASLAVEAPPSDARILAWQAFRYGVDAVWVENAAESDSSWLSRGLIGGDALVYSGEDYGLLDRPVPSIRLKRLRRGLLDYELLHLLERRGKPLLAGRTAEQLVRWAFTDACEENLLSVRPTGWPDNAYIFWLARTVLLQELVNEFAPSTAGRSRQIGNLSDWGALMNQATQIQAEVRGVRLEPEGDALRARVFANLSNGTDRTLAGRWQIPSLPVGWSLLNEQTSSVAPNGRVTAAIDLRLTGLTYNPDGAYPFQLLFDTETTGAFSALGRLAIAACPQVDKSPVVDGSLADWMLATNNVAGDFRLVRGEGIGARTGVPREPTLATRAFFCVDNERLYVAVRCQVEPGEQPVWRADNTIPIDGAIPWGQDVVEILLDPHNTPRGTGGEIFCLQIKPSGLLVARHGCLTDPPMNASELWQSGARVAVSRQTDAWVVEVGIPLEALGRAAQRNRIWGCNITRLDARRGEYSSWSGARGYTYAPHLLGNLLLLRP